MMNYSTIRLLILNPVKKLIAKSSGIRVLPLFQFLFVSSFTVDEFELSLGIFIAQVQIRHVSNTLDTENLRISMNGTIITAVLFFATSACTSTLSRESSLDVHLLLRRTICIRQQIISLSLSIFTS